MFSSSAVKTILSPAVILSTVYGRFGFPLLKIHHQKSWLRCWENWYIALTSGQTFHGEKLRLLGARLPSESILRSATMAAASDRTWR